jgi:hypothetical protein
VAEVGSEAIDPGGQAGLAPKNRRAARDPDKSLLGQVFGFVLGHAHQVVEDEALVFVKDAGKAQEIYPFCN